MSMWRSSDKKRAEEGRLGRGQRGGCGNNKGAWEKIATEGTNGEIGETGKEFPCTQGLASEGGIQGVENRSKRIGIGKVVQLDNEDR